MLDSPFLPASPVLGVIVLIGALVNHLLTVSPVKPVSEAVFSPSLVSS